MSTPVATLGAYDRFNFGDLLFPHVLEDANRRLGEPARLEHYAVSRADMRGHGGHHVRDIQDLAAVFRDRREPVPLIVGGGEIVGAGWFSMLTSLPGYRASVARALRKLPRRGREAYARAALRAPWSAPFVPDGRVSARTAYSAIGGSHSTLLPKVEQERRWNTLKRAVHLSVRDTATAKLASRHGVAARLVPDSVAALPRVPTFSEAFSALQPPGRRILVFQASASWVERNLAQVTPQLRELSALGLNIRLVPVGLAAAHSDQVGLGRLATLLPAEVSLVEVDDVHAIVETIAAADVVVASSLHVNIVAMAAARPHVGLTGVRKLQEYLATWGHGISSSSIPVEALASTVVELLERPEYEQRLLRSSQLGNLAGADTELLLRSIVDA